MKTDITFILDRSGSMQATANDAMGGFNQFIQSQKSVDGEATFSLVQFDDVIETVYSGLPIETVPELTSKTFIPRGYTALHDAIGKTVVSIGARLNKLANADKPDKVVVVIITDGDENASREYNSKSINEMITHQREVYSWEFVFIGANQDAISTAKSFGIAGASAMTYAANSIGTQAAYASLSRSVSSFRSGTTNSMNFAPEDYGTQQGVQ